MFFYVGKRISVTSTGAVPVDCVCEKCRSRYRYERVRAVTGSSEAPYYIGQVGAQSRAAEYAARDLQRALAADIDLVACPKCQWVNESTVKNHRQSRYGRVGVGAWILGVLAVVGTFLASVFYLASNPSSFNVGPLVLVLGLLLGAGITLSMLSLQRRLRNRIDPNIYHPKPPTLPPGTPVAVLIDANGQILPMSAKLPAEPWTGWAMFQVGKNFLPECCCECLGAPETVFSMPFKVDSNSELPVPLCRRCLGRLRVRWWLTVLLSIILSALLATGVFLIPFPDRTGAWWMYGMLAGFLGLFAAAIVPSRVVQPYKRKPIDAARGLYSFRFRNEAYTRMIDSQRTPT